LGFHLTRVVVHDGVVYRWERNALPRSPEFTTEDEPLAWVADAIAHATWFDK
jgi:hypothetical protein